MDMLAVLIHQLQQLRQKAEQLDAKSTVGKPQNWFDSNVFGCRSPHLTDYVAETQRNLQRLHTEQLSGDTRQRLVQRLSDQISALTQAFRNADIRSKPTAKTATKVVIQQATASSQQLYQQLSDIQQFERRLLDMIELASRDNRPDAVQRTLALHARLGRCRKALSDVERQIQELERRA